MCDTPKGIYFSELKNLGGGSGTRRVSYASCIYSPCVRFYITFKLGLVYVSETLDQQTLMVKASSYVSCSHLGTILLYLVQVWALFSCFIIIFYRIM